MPEPLRLSVASVATPIGVARVVTDADGALRALGWVDLEERLQRSLDLHARLQPFVLEESEPPEAVPRALARYFAGELSAIDALPVALVGTAFQCTAWRGLRAIAAGRTETYAALAARLGRPAAVRAVGAANGANPVSIVLPCHRVVGSDGSLTGYGGGLERKEWLLRHEGAR